MSNSNTKESPAKSVKIASTSSRYEFRPRIQSAKSTDEDKPVNTEVKDEKKRPEQKITKATQVSVEIGIQNTEEDNKSEENTHAIMNQREIQKSITSFVPEFSGENTPNRDKELTRFIGTADSIFESLTKEEEKQTFNKLIQYRLTGDAYIRIMHRQINDYKTLRETLENMYKKTQSLDELEREFMNTQQSYGETVRNFGYRILEALQKYKSGFVTKYDLNQVDQAYTRHLNETAVQIFKMGLNNVILKDKIATIKAKTVDEIISEAEETEKILVFNGHTPPQQSQTYPNRQKIQTQMIPRQPPAVLCNFCQKPYHTWDVCRSRIAQENATRRTTPHSTNTIPYVNKYTPANQYPVQRNGNNYNQANNQVNQRNQNYNYPEPKGINNMNRGFSQQYRPNMNYTNQAPQYQPKYCSHCKVTKGHTFDECRNKFLQPRMYNNVQNMNHIPNKQNYSTQNFNRMNSKPPENTNLEERLNKTRINVINPQQQQQYNNEEHINPENSNGSSHV